jgi:hypothetical protein
LAIFEVTRKQLGKNIIFTLCGLFILSTLLIIFTDSKSRSLFTNLPETIAAGFAFGFSLILLFRLVKNAFASKNDLNHDHHHHDHNTGVIRHLKQATSSIDGELLTQLFLTLAIGSWFSAEMIYSYYQVWLNVETPFPSIADPFYLIGYGLFAVYLYRVLRVSVKTISRDIIGLISFAVALSIGYILNLSFGVAQIVSIQQNTLTTTLSVTYPVLDAVLLVPAVTILWGIRMGALEHTHWFLISLFIIFETIADIGFGYAAVIGKLDQAEWIWDILYNAAYITLAASLFCESRYNPDNHIFGKETTIPDKTTM